MSGHSARSGQQALGGGGEVLMESRLHRPRLHQSFPVSMFIGLPNRVPPASLILRNLYCGGNPAIPVLFSARCPAVAGHRQSPPASCAPGLAHNISRALLAQRHTAVSGRQACTATGHDAPICADSPAAAPCILHSQRVHPAPGVDTWWDAAGIGLGGGQAVTGQSGDRAVAATAWAAGVAADRALLAVAGAQLGQQAVQLIERAKRNRHLALFTPLGAAVHADFNLRRQRIGKLLFQSHDVA